MKTSRPSLAISTIVVALFTAGWGYLRLVLFSDTLLPLTFVLPLLVCVWTGRRWQLWSMAVVFAVMAVIEVKWILPAGHFTPQQMTSFLVTTLINICVGAVVIHAIIAMRANLEARNARISAQNAELETQSEELLQQNEEIKTQAEELVGQNEEIEAQAEEYARQNDELTELNQRVTARESILENVVSSMRAQRPIDQALAALCACAQAVLGSRVAEVSILEPEGGMLKVHSRSSDAEAALTPACWPLEGSLTGVVLGERRTAYVSELRKAPELAQPFPEDSPVQSVLATPVFLASRGTGLLVVCSESAGHWTDEQFRLIEWVASQCALLLEALRNQEALSKHAEALENANQAKDRFLAMLSHELRTPLTPVLLWAGAMEEDDRLSEDVREDARMIRRNVNIQSRLIDDLLDLTRIGRGKVELDRQIIDAATLLRDSAEVVDADLKGKRHSLHLDLDGARDGKLFGDAARLQQVFWNLLKNAIKFTPEGGRIELRARIEEDQLRVEVRDSGVGIDPTDAERIFLPFEQRLAGPRQASDSGLGLGLAIVKAVVEMHGGQISLHSAGRDLGSTFVVTLPLATSNVVPDHTGDHAGNGLPPAAELRLLVIEDHADTGELIAKVLRHVGYEVDYAKTAASALQRVADSAYDVVISDLGLPDENGLELMRKLHAIRPDLSGICMSGYGMEHDVAASRDAGFVEHLTKPVDLAQLKTIVARVAAERKGEPALAACK